MDTRDTAINLSENAVPVLKKPEDVTTRLSPTEARSRTHTGWIPARGARAKDDLGTAEARS